MAEVMAHAAGVHDTSTGIDAARSTPMPSLLQSRQVRGAPEQAASRTPPVITRAEACPRGHGRMDLHYANWESGLSVNWLRVLQLALTSYNI